MKELFPKHIVKRNKPVNLIAEHDYLFQHEYQVEIPSSNFIILKNCYLLKNTIFSLTPLKYYWDYTHHFIPGLLDKISLFKLLFKKPTFVQQAIWIVNEWSEGYFHWFTDALPRLLAVKDMTDCKLVVLPDKYASYSYVDDSLHKLGFKAQYYAPQNPCKVSELLLPSHTAPTGNYNVGLINDVRRSLVPSKKITPSKRIYISRKKAKARIISARGISNEEELETLLKQYDFEIHYFEDYSLEKQIEVMHETEVLLGLHGAGLANMLYMQENTKVLELRNENDNHNNCYFSLASALNIHYYYMVNKGNSTDTSEVSITVNMLALKQILETMFLSSDV